jgi:hypothetical protein
MAIVGAMSLARSAKITGLARVVPGRVVLPRHIIDASTFEDETPIETRNTVETEELLGEHATRHDEG